MKKKDKNFNYFYLKNEQLKRELECSRELREQKCS